MEIVEEARMWMENYFQAETTGHDWEHIKRVLNTSLYLQKKEGGNIKYISLIALFHDYCDEKLTLDPAGKEQELETWLKIHHLSQGEISKIIHGIKTISFKKGKNPYKATTIEEKIVQDADRLDAIGAIGIARAFTYGGSQGRTIINKENPEISTVQHFYDKLFLIKDFMQTETGKDIATIRHERMNTFIHDLFEEINM